MCVLFCILTSAQYRIDGTVTDESGKTLSGAHIHVLSVHAFSQADGSFTAQNLPAGQQRFYVTHDLCKPLDTTLTVPANGLVKFILKPSEHRLESVTVRSGRQEFSATVKEDKLKSSTLEKYSSASLGDALREIAGVTALKTGSTVVKPVINGLYGIRVPVIASGIRLEDQQWGAEHAPNTDVNAAGSVSVIKGASALQYGGDAIGGMVIIEPVSSTRDTIFGKSILTLNSNGRGGAFTTSLHRGNFCDWAWNVSASGKYMGDREAPDYVLSNTGNREANFYADAKYIGKNADLKFSYSLYSATLGILRAAHTGNVNDLYNSINNQVPSVVDDFTYATDNPRQKVMHHVIQADYLRRISDKSSLQIRYAFQLNNRKEFDLRRGDFKDVPALDLQLITHTATADYKIKADATNLKTGFVLSAQSNFANPDTGVMPLIPTYTRLDGGWYGVASRNLADGSTLEGGIRYDISKMDARKFYLKSRWTERGYDEQFSHFIVGESGNQWETNPIFTFHNVSASAGWTKNFINGWEVFANLNMAARNPGPSELFSDGLHHSTGIIELGDLSLEREVGFKFNATVQKQWEAVTVSVNPYLNRINGFMYLAPTGFETTTRGAFPVWEYRQTDARLWGIDVKATANLFDVWQYQFLAAYLNGLNVVSNEPLIDMPPFNLSQRILFKKPQWNGFTAELRSEFTARQSRYPDNNFETNIVQGDQLVPVLVDISSPPASFHLMHLQAQMEFKGFGAGQLTVGVAVHNIFDTSYREYLNRQRFFADEPGRNVQLQLKLTY